MAFTSTQSAYYIKENVSVKPFTSQRRDTNAHRQRSRPHNTSLAPSRRHATREAARRISHSTPVVPHSRTHGFAAEDVDMEDEPPVNFSSTTYSQKNTSLPRQLRRPAFRGIAPAAISAIDPDLREIPIEFIHRKIQSIGEHMFAAAAKTVTACPKGRLPRELEVVVNDVSAYTPTHLFAVYSQPSALQKQRIALYPGHALVLAANCAHLPPLPYSKPGTPTYPGSTVTLPVVPLCIPSPETFPLLLDYLYTQRGSHLLRTLLPLTPKADTQSPAQLSRELAEMFTAPALRTHMHMTHGLWGNVAALGVFDENLWRGMEVAWEVLHDALAASSGERWSL